MAKKIASIAYWVLIIMLFICILWFKPKYIETGSMKPTLQVGAISIIDPHTMPAVGDIGMYQIGGGGYVIHRVSRIDDEGKYIFKGDNNSSEDFQAIPESSIVGREVFHINVVAPLVRLIRHLEDK